MRKNLQFQARVLAAAFLLAAAVGQNAAEAGESKLSLFGRWTVIDPNEKYSVNGKLYRVVDIAPCGHEICGVSADGGACGVTLFRVPPVIDDLGLNGRAKWGAADRLFVAQSMGAAGDNDLFLLLGDQDAHIGSRSSVPTFQARYHRTGDGVCAGEAPST